MKGFIKNFLPFLLLTGFYNIAYAQLLDDKTTFTYADTIRGTITPERAWWDVTHYDLDLKFNLDKKYVVGINKMSFKVLEAGDKMQIDLMDPMKIESITYNGKPVPFKKDGSVYILHYKEMFAAGDQAVIDIAFSGSPRVAKNPPWDGGFIWKTDANGKPFVSVACQGLGASVWYPNKDQQADEPDSARMHITIPKDLVGISNGKFESRSVNNDGTVTFTWKVVNPINNYNLVFYIGDYARYNETYQGENGALEVDLWFLAHNMDKAKSHVLPEVKRTLEAFEYWFGPFPFYEDGFKIVEAPHLGMEHQSAVAYGNNFKYGYLGFDLSGAGPGERWDYIVVHEVGHEWFANNISTKDIADMWVHEGITSYSEVLFTEYFYGKKDADAYMQGIRNNIENKSPVIGKYGVNSEGSGDMYAKGSALMHTIRQIMDNDVKFRKMLREMNADFYHQTVTSAQIEKYISDAAGFDMSKIFNQYLRTIKIPELEYNIVTNQKGVFLVYRWGNAIPGFNMPVRLRIKGGPVWVKPSDLPMRLQIPGMDAVDEQNFVDPNFYITVKKTDLQ